MKPAETGIDVKRIQVPAGFHMAVCKEGSETHKEPDRSFILTNRLTVDKSVNIYKFML